MRRHRPVAASLDASARRIVNDQVIELEVDRLEDLFENPTIDPFDGRVRPLRAGIVELGETLTALRRLPDELSVRIVVPPAALAARPAADVEAAVHRRAEVLAAASWRDAMAVRNMGRRQTPLGIVIGLVAGATAFGFAYLAQQAGSDLAVAAYAVAAALSLTLAWIVAWVTIESALLDWRLDGRIADAYELLARSNVVLATRELPVDGP